MIVDIHAHYGQWLSSKEPDTPARFSETLDRFGIGASVVSSSRAVQYEIMSGNAEVAELLEHDARIYGAIVVNPNHREASLAELSRHGQNERFLAVKLHPDYCGVPADAPLNLAIYRRVNELRMPLFIHTWGAAEVEAAAAVARAFPEMTVFMFHMGADAWRSAIQRAREYPNLFLEIVSTILQPRWIEKAVETVGAKRVFFGTDMTLISPAYAMGMLWAARLSDRDREVIMGANAQELFHLD